MPRQWGGKKTFQKWNSVAKGSRVTVSKLSTGEFLRDEPALHNFRFRESAKPITIKPKKKKAALKVQYKTATEALMFSVLNIMFKGKKYKQHYRPNWLKNPDTGKNLELDRYYPGLKLAFEYNGRHHLNKYQMYKDSVKQSVCLSRNIALVIIPSTDSLSVERVQNLIDKAKKELEEKRSV